MPLATNRTNSTASVDAHPADHNALAEAVNRFEARIIDVTASPYSADSTGATDANTAIAAAVAAATSGQTVYLPPGTYRIGGSLGNVPSGVRIMGAGMGATTLIRKAAYVGAELVRLVGARSALSDLIIDGNWTGVDGLASMADVTMSGDDTLCERVRFINPNYISLTVSAIRGRVSDSIFVGAGVTGANKDTKGAMYGIWADNTSHRGVTVDGCSFRDYRYGAANVTGRNFKFVGCHFENNHISDTPTGGGQVLFATTGSARAAGLMLGCTFGAGGGAETYAIEVDSPGIAIVGNTMEGGGVSQLGINLQSAQQAVVLGNVVRNHKRAGIEVQSGVVGAIIQGNRCYDDQGTPTQTSGIRIVNGADYLTVVGNDLRGNTTNGLLDLSTTANKIVLGNHPSADSTLVGDVSATGGYRQTIDGWFLENVVGTVTNAALTRLATTTNNPNAWIAPRAGSITALLIHSNAARTAGTLTATVFKNGSATTLTAILDATNTTLKVTTSAKDALVFAAGDLLDIRYTTVGWTPTTADVRASVEVET